jgi:hypothetical protein
MRRNPAVIYMTGAFSIMPQPESKIVRRIRQEIEKQGGRCFKIHGEDTFQEVGIPDLLCCYRGRFVGLEVKQPGNKPSPMQRVVLNEIVAAGGYAAVVTTVEQVVHLLATIDEEVNHPLSRDSNRRSILDRSLARQGGK